MKSAMSKIPILMLMAVACSQLVFTDRTAEFEKIRDKSEAKVVVLEAKLKKLAYLSDGYQGSKREAKKAEHRYLSRLLDNFEQGIWQVDEVSSEQLDEYRESIPQELKDLESKIDAAFVTREA